MSYYMYTYCIYYTDIFINTYTYAHTYIDGNTLRLRSGE